MTLSWLHLRLFRPDAVSLVMHAAQALIEVLALLMHSEFNSNVLRYIKPCSDVLMYKPVIFSIWVDACDNAPWAKAAILEVHNAKRSIATLSRRSISNPEQHQLEKEQRHGITYIEVVCVRFRLLIACNKGLFQFLTAHVNFGKLACDKEFPVKLISNDWPTQAKWRAHKIHPKTNEDFTLISDEQQCNPRYQHEKNFHCSVVRSYFLEAYKAETHDLYGLYNKQELKATIRFRMNINSKFLIYRVYIHIVLYIAVMNVQVLILNYQLAARTIVLTMLFLPSRSSSSSSKSSSSSSSNSTGIQSTKN
ncbi:hypothetical protein GQX74_010272 [Glossina fuscipes]|nr:hypothetical protein GQX74_010272 [Glossina fuscipes]